MRLVLAGLVWAFDIEAVREVDSGLGAAENVSNVAKKAI